MTDYEAYEKWCRSGMTRRQIAKLHGVTDTEMQDIISLYSSGNFPSNNAMARATMERQYLIAKREYERAGFKHPPRSTQDERMLAIELRHKGFAFKAIAKAFGRAPEAIRAWVDDYERRHKARESK